MPRYLIAESETPDEREMRRNHAGNSSGETYAETLRQMVPGSTVDLTYPSDDDGEPMTAAAAARYDAVFLSGSPMHVYEDSPEVDRQLAFMRAVFASGTPSFGSCAGLQLAVAAAGGRVRRMPRRMEAGLSRRLVTTDAGRDHPLLAGRTGSWDAPAIHGDEVEALPEGGVLLATNGATRVQAVEICHSGATFWGVQYHPELAPGEIAAALRRQVADLIEEGLADGEDEVERQARLFDALHDDPGDAAARWQLGVDDSFADEAARRTELRNFLDAAPALKRRFAG